MEHGTGNAEKIGKKSQSQSHEQVPYGIFPRGFVGILHHIDSAAFSGSFRKKGPKDKSVLLNDRTDKYEGYDGTCRNRIVCVDKSDGRRSISHQGQKPFQSKADKG